MADPSQRHYPLGRIPEGATLIMPDTSTDRERERQRESQRQRKMQHLGQTLHILRGTSAACQTLRLHLEPPPHLKRIIQRMAAVTQNTDATRASLTASLSFLLAEFSI